MKGMKISVGGLLVAFFFVLLAVAGPALADTGEGFETPEQLVASLHFRTGEIAVPEAVAHLRLGADFRYLDKRDAHTVLESLWGNPPDEDVLGMIVPMQPALLDEESWAVVLTYSDDGYVSDGDAADIDYTELLADMQKDIRDSNDARKQAGYATLELLGWAVPPYYDSGSKKLYWAKQISFEGSDIDTLNYDIRVLGRRGYLSLNAVAGMPELAQVKRGMEELLPMVEFDAGARYADHNPSTDRIAAYGVAALVGGGLAAKTGLFAKLGLVLLKFWKLLAIGGVALVALLRKLLSGKGDDKMGR